MSHISPEEAQFLEQEQCFRIPIRPMLNDFVREYFLHVHPNVPFLNEGDFWDMYIQRDYSASKKSQISLFLFQAMLFAACSVCLDHLRRALVNHKLFTLLTDK